MESYDISWQAPEFVQAERSASWYLWSIVVAGILILIALFQGNFLFALFILIAEILLVTVGRQSPANHLYVINKEGLFFDEQPLRLFSESSGFAFFPLGGRHVELVLRPIKKLHTYVKVLVPEERVEDIERVLAHHMTSFEYNGTVSDALARWLKL